MPTAAPEPLRVLLVCSSGGHLGQLAPLLPWLDARGHEQLWVTFDTADARDVLAGRPVVAAHHPTTRNVPNLLRNAALAVRVLRRFRPDVVVSSGAGVALPFFALAPLVGARTVYLEVYDRIDTASLTGRLLAPVSSAVAVQWEEQRRLYPRAVTVGRLL